MKLTKIYWLKIQPLKSIGQKEDELKPACFFKQGFECKEDR